MIFSTVTSILVLALANILSVEAAQRNLQYGYSYAYYSYAYSTASTSLETAASIATGAIIGIIVGVVVCVAITVFCIVWFCCTHKVMVNGQMKRQCKFCGNKQAP